MRAFGVGMFKSEHGLVLVLLSEIIFVGLVLMKLLLYYNYIILIIDVLELESRNGNVSLL